MLIFFGGFMRKFLLILVVFSLFAGFAMAQSDGAGLTLGVEFGIGGVNKPNNASEMYPYVTPMVIFENSFLDGAFDLYAELDYTFEFIKMENTFPMDLYFDLSLGYNLGLSRNSTLSFILENENGFLLAPNYGAEFLDRLWGVGRPGIKFTQGIASAGSVYALVDAPIQYLGADSGMPIGLDGSVGWDSSFGLGLKGKAHMLLIPGSDSGYQGVDVTAYFENGPLYVGAEVRIPNEKNGFSSYFDRDDNKIGIAVTPEVQFTFDFGLGIYANCALGNLTGAGDMYISPAVGVTFSF